MKILAPQALEAFFLQLTAAYEVRLPVLLPDGDRAFGAPGDGPVALSGGPLPAKPTTVFFPQEEVLFALDGTGQTRSTAEQKPLLVAGFTARDLLCLRFADRFFAEGWRDDVYFRRRERAVIAAVSGYCGADGALLPLSGGECDLEFVAVDSHWLVIAYSEQGARIAALLPDEAAEDALAGILTAPAVSGTADQDLINAAAELLAADLVPDSFWEEIAASCIQCTGCNLVCPTCTCFGMQDWRYADRVERSRMWDSCQLEGFMREAGGNNPLGSEALRTRRRIHHKLAADRVKWGELGCFVCGRCDAVCPTGIGIVAVCRRMVAAFGARDRRLKAG
jgi:ferredoxin